MNRGEHILKAPIECIMVVFPAKSEKSGTRMGLPPVRSFAHIRLKPPVESIYRLVYVLPLSI
jgi:hypothetical protein